MLIKLMNKMKQNQYFSRFALMNNFLSFDYKRGQYMVYHKNGNQFEITRYLNGEDFLILQTSDTIEFKNILNKLEKEYSQ